MVAPKAVYGKEICDKIILLSPRCGCKWSRLGKYCKRFRVTVQRLAAPGLLAPGCGRQVPVSKLAPVNQKENTAFGPEKNHISRKAWRVLANASATAGFPRRDIRNPRRSCHYASCYRSEVFCAARYGCHDWRSAECSYDGAGGHPGAKPILGVITKINILNYYCM